MTKMKAKRKTSQDKWYIPKPTDNLNIKFLGDPPSFNYYHHYEEKTLKLYKDMKDQWNKECQEAIAKAEAEEAKRIYHPEVGDVVKIILSKNDTFTFMILKLEPHPARTEETLHSDLATIWIIHREFPYQPYVGKKYHQGSKMDLAIPADIKLGPSRDAPLRSEWYLISRCSEKETC